MPKSDLSRREFLKLAGLAAAWSCVPKALSAETKADAGNSAAVLVDLTRCIGCRSCTRACRRQNHLQENNDAADASPLEGRMDLAWNEFTVVNAATSKAAGRADLTRFVKQQCMHCVDPACASACPVAALYKQESGPVLYREERCIGCRYCQVACPFDIPKFEWESGLSPVIGKCNFCAAQRLFHGSPTACVEACPTGTLKFGTRAALLAEAHERINAHPEKYINHVYGETEAGGTSWLYISDVPFADLGFKQNLPPSPMPSFTWEVISRLPSLAAALALLFGMVATSLKKHHGGHAA